MHVKFLRQFMIILAVAMAGEILSALIPLPIPASIYGIVLMLALLMTGVLRTKQVKEVSAFLIEIMPLMFVPATVGLMQSYRLLAPSLGAYVVIIIVSTVAVMAVSGLVTQRVIEKEEKKEDVRDA